VLNSRIRKAWLAGAEIAMIGENVDLSYPHHQLGDGPAALAGESRGEIVEFMKARSAPVVIVGGEALTRADGAAINGAAMKLAADVGGSFMVLHTAASRVGGMDIGFAHGDGLGCLDGARLVFNLGADEIDMPADAFVVYQGSHGDRGAGRADVILPAAAWTEQSGIFVNTEGRPQMASRAGFPPGEAKEDWAILRALSAVLGRTLPYDTLGALRAALFAEHPHLAALDAVPENPWQPAGRGRMSKTPIAGSGTDHYLANPVLRASTIMADLSRLAAGRTPRMAAE